MEERGTEALDQNISPREAPHAAAGKASPKNTGLSRHWITAILFLGVFAFCVPTIPSVDTWWHLATGRYILQAHAVPHADPFSSTVAGKPWIAHEWLSAVVFYLGYFPDRLGGTASPDRVRSRALFLASLPAFRRALACKDSCACSRCMGHQSDLLRAAANLYLSARIPFYRAAHPFPPERLLPAPHSFAAPDNSLGEPSRRLYSWSHVHSSVRRGCRLRLGCGSGGAGGNEKARRPTPESPARHAWPWCP